MSLPERERGELLPVVVQPFAVSSRVHVADQVRREVDEAGAVAGGDFAEISTRVTLHARLVASEASREICHGTAEGGPRDDLLLHEARHLIARTPQAPFGPV